MKINLLASVGLAICTLTVGAAVGILCNLDLITKGRSTIQVQTMYDLNDNFSREKVRSYLIELHVKYPDVAMAQMDLESAGGTSNISMQNNNIFGMKLATQRPTTALGEKNG